MIALLIGTRREYVPLSDSPHGEGLRSYFNRRSSGFRVNRFCRGVLVLPDDHATYLRGRRREALRRNLRKAARASIRCELVSDRSRAAADLLELLGGRPEPPAEADLDGWYRFVALPELQFVVARDPAGAPVAVAGVVIDETVCLLRLALANSHEARWMLHDYLVQLLIARRVKYLVSEGGGPFGALGFSPGVQHYQHLLGYELLHVIPERARVRLRRTVASLTTIAGTVSLVVAGVASCGSAT